MTECHHEDDIGRQIEVWVWSGYNETEAPEHRDGLYEDDARHRHPQRRRETPNTTGDAMRLFRILIPVPDIDRAEKFYAALFSTPGERVSPERHYFKSGDVVVACYAPGGDGKPFRPLETETYFAVADLEAMHTRALAAGAKPSTEHQDHHGHLGLIERRPWGERSFYVTDPFGNPLCFVDDKTLFTGR